MNPVGLAFLLMASGLFWSCLVPLTVWFAIPAILAETMALPFLLMAALRP